MNYTVGSCGHSKPAVGAPGSRARAESESSPCRACRAQEARDRDEVISGLRLKAYAAGRAYRSACTVLVSCPHAVPLSQEMTCGMVSGILEMDPETFTVEELGILACAYNDGFRA